MTTQPDPIFAAIERWRALWTVYMAACHIEDGAACEAAVNQTHRAAYDALREVYQTEPTTPAGLLAMMEVMLEADGDHLHIIEQDEPAEMDDAERGMIAIFRNAKRMLEQMQ